MDLRHIKKTFKKGKIEGYACLLSLLNYYEGYLNRSLEHYFITTNLMECNTLLKIHEVAKSLGLDSDAYEADIQDLKKMMNPVILLVSSEVNKQNFIICYGYDGRFLVGDPTWGIVQYTEEELSLIWHSKVMLDVKPNSSLLRITLVKEKKKKFLKNTLMQSRKQLILVFILGLLLSLSILLPFFLLSRIDFSRTTLLYTIITLSSVLLVVLFFFFQRSLVLFNRSFSIFFLKPMTNSLINQFLKYESNQNPGIISIILNNDYNEINGVKEILIFWAFYFPITLISITGLGFLNLSVFLIFLFWWVVYVLCFLLYQKHVVKCYKETQIGLQKFSFYSWYIFRYNSIIKTHGKEIFFATQYQNICNNLRKMTTKMEISIDTVKFLLFLVDAVIIVLFVGIILNEKASTSLMLKSILLATLSLIALKQSPKIFFETIRVKNVLDRHFDFCYLSSLDSQIDNHLNIRNSIIQKISLHHISFRYPGSKRILEDISIELVKSKIYVLYGLNGSGKTTLLEVLKQNLIPESGKFSVNENELTPDGRKVLQKSIMLVPNHLQLIGGNVINNIAVGSLPNKEATIVDFCAYIGVTKFIQQLPNGFKTNIGDNPDKLPNGLAKILSLSRALFANPSLLLLEEPYAGVDTITSEFIESLLQKIKVDMPILIATTDLRVAQKADFVYVLNQGKILQQGLPGEIIT